MLVVKQPLVFKCQTLVKIHLTMLQIRSLSIIVWDLTAS